MKQVKLENVLWVLTTTPYRITEDTDVSLINVHCNYIEQFRSLNPSLNLTPYNYLLLTKHTQPYYEYLDDKENKDFTFPKSVINTSCFVDETKTLTIQSLSVPEDYDGEISYYLDGVLLDSSSITLNNPSNYIVSANAVNSSIYADDTSSFYTINFEKFKRDATLSFAQNSINVSTYVDLNYFNYVQELTKNPADIDVNYYLDASKLAGNSYNLTSAGKHIIVAAVEDNSIYNDCSTSYEINYTKVKRTASISFANATVEVSTYKDENYSGTIQTLTGVPNGITPKYYLDSSLLSDNNIVISSEGNHVVKGAIENHPVYNDSSVNYTISYSKVKRDAVLSFADSSVNITVEDDTTYSGSVQAVTGLPAGQTANYYLGNTLISNGTISISDLQEGENTYTVTAAIENSSYYNDSSASYTLNITMEISSYENKYFTIEPLEDGTIKFSMNDLQYSTDNKKTWNTLNANTSLGVTTGHKVLFKCTSPTKNNYGIGTFGSSGQFNVLGNIMSLKYGDNFENQTNIDSDQFKNLFKNSKVVNAENLILSARTASYAYQSTFENCNLLIKPPLLNHGEIGNYCYQDLFSGCSSLSYIKVLSNYSKYNNKYMTWVKNVSTNGTFIKAKNQVFPFGISGIPFNWKVINNETNKEVYPLLFNTASVNVSTYTNQTYSGTIQDISCNRTIPNGLVKYYLDSSLLEDNNITLTTPGVHTVLAEIVADSSIDDSSASYTINYTQEKRDITFSATWSKQPDANGYDVGDSEYCPSPTMHQSPSSPSASPSALYNILDSEDNPLFSWSAGWPNNSKLYTTAAGTYSCAVKYTISSVDANYKPTEQICKWTYTVNAAQEQSSPYYVDLEAYVYPDGEEEPGIMHLYNGEQITGATTFQKIVPFYYDENENLIEGEPYNLSVLDEAVGYVEELAEGSYNWRVYLNSSIVPAYAFTYCDQYTSIELSNGIYKVDQDAFKGCSSVQNLHLNEDGNLKIIDTDAFQGIDTASNTGINIVIPDSVTSIAPGAFSGEIPWGQCLIFAETPPELGTYAFSEIDVLEESNRTIQVPSDSVNAYKTAPGWSYYASVIVPM